MSCICEVGIQRLEADTAARFTSYTYDPVIGKYFAKERFYDSAQGRMLSPDPVKRGLNPYLYCDNDPVNYNDPTGEIPSILAGGLLGGFFGGASGFLGSTISQVMSGEKFSWRKALGSTANGAVVGAAKGALIGSGAGIPAALAADFAAGASGNALEQWITKGRVDARESLLSGAGNALSELLYGTGEIKGLGDAFIRGARTGAVMSGIENLAGTAGLYGWESERNPRGGGHSRISGRPGRDPKGMCGSEDPFDLGTGLGRSGRGYHGEAGRGRTDNGGFSLGGFVKDVLTGAAVGGLGSAGFYGAGKAVEALKGSFVGRRSSLDAIDNSNLLFRKAKDASYIEPMPKKQLRRIVKAFRRQGGIIQMDNITDTYLATKKSEAITLNEKTILLRQNPGRASVFEELIHATQFRQGLNDGSAISRIQNEIAAQEMLLNNSKAYKLSPAEVKQTQSALVSYIGALQKLMGGK